MRAAALKVSWCTALILIALSAGAAIAQENKKTDDEKPADPDTGESTVEESTLGLLPIPSRNTGSSSRQPTLAKRWAMSPAD